MRVRIDRKRNAQTYGRLSNMPVGYAVAFTRRDFQSNALLPCEKEVVLTYESRMSKDIDPSLYSSPVGAFDHRLDNRLAMYDNDPGAKLSDFFHKIPNQCRRHMSDLGARQ